MIKKIKSKWIKTIPYGDYNNPEDNHKKDYVDMAHYNAVRHARRIGIRHPGSKTMKVLKTHL